MNAVNVHFIYSISNLPNESTGSDLNPISLAVIVLNLLCIHIVLLMWDGILLMWLILEK